MRVLITGSRSWNNVDIIRKQLIAIDEDYGTCTLVSGHCPIGADAIGEHIAESLGWTIERYAADWDKHGKRAGFVRNKKMVDTNPDMCLAFIHNNSKGATMTHNLSISAGIPTTSFHLRS